MPHKALEIATHFIQVADAAQKPISNKKLQKLLYYAQVWYYTLFGVRLFSEEMEAWVHGPVVRKVYGYYKEFNFSPIILKEGAKSAELNEVEIRFLKNIWDVYGKYDANYLEALSHSEQPWQVARQGVESHAASDTKIHLKIAKAFYEQKIEKA